MRIRSADLLPPVIIVGIAIAIWIVNLTTCIPWGDDWAGYLQQARSFANGDPFTELTENKKVIVGSDVQIGPYAYPWGYPALLAIVGAIGGWGMTTLKALGLAALIVSVLGGYAIARRFLSAPAAYISALLATVQAIILINASIIASDTSFLALSTLALLGCVLAYESWLSGSRAATISLVWLSVASVAAFSIRSNGIVVAGTVLGCLVAVAMRNSGTWRSLSRQTLAYVALMAALTWGYFAAFPDGSLSHLDELSLDARVWVGRMGSHLREFSLFFPFSTLKGTLKLALLSPFLALALLGVISRFWTCLPLTLWSVGHLAIVTVFPHSGGPRYYFPILLPLLILAALGSAALSERLPGMIAVAARNTRLRLAACGFITAAAAYSAGTGVAAFRVTCEGTVGPFSERTSELVSFIGKSVPSSALIAFRKPRALRYLSGRHAIAVQEPGNLSRVDFYVFDRDGLDNQVPEQVIEKSGEFFRFAEIQPFRIYARRGPGREAEP
jgi:hypothetical protein